MIIFRNSLHKISFMITNNENLILFKIRMKEKIVMRELWIVQGYGGVPTARWKRVRYLLNTSLSQVGVTSLEEVINRIYYESPTEYGRNVIVAYDEEEGE